MFMEDWYMSHKLTRLSLISLSLLAGLSANIQAHAASVGCNQNCIDYLRENVQARPLTAASIATLGNAALQSQFTSYLNTSISARNSDKAALAAERNNLTNIPAPRSSDEGHDLDTMPLNKPASYYQSAQALNIARDILSFQIPSGGWGKNMPHTGVERAKGQSYTIDNLDPSESGRWRYVGTIDNGSTTTELRYLAKVQATRAEGADTTRIRAGIVRGLKYLLAAQYPNGGWPQVYPLAGGYNDAITINDDAMLRVVMLLNEIGNGSNSDFAFLDSRTRNSIAQSAAKGITWLIDNQVSIDGTLTVWGQQHDVLTQEPTAARAFEMASLTSGESAKIVEFLMTLPNPNAALRRSLYAAADFFTATRITGQSWSNGKLSSSPNGVLWARYYDLASYTPGASRVEKRAQTLFGDFPKTHDSSAYGLVFGSVASVSTERLTGYAQYVSSPQRVLTTFAVWSKSNARP
ncbi:pectate lyase [Dickeya fangzhongdai]|uniref:pectate lyase n=1 Tax=Dickeya fangzhongdai TaxID=1778540 RepID=UPI0009DEBCB0|nr:pectate lyase [Dickeya fangzhongdai]